MKIENAHIIYVYFLWKKESEICSAVLKSDKITENGTISLWFWCNIYNILMLVKMICKWQTYGNIRTQSQGPKLCIVW